MGIERRIENLEKATEEGKHGLVIVWPVSIEQVHTTEAEVKEAVKSYEAQHGYPPATILRVAYDGNKGES